MCVHLRETNAKSWQQKTLRKPPSVSLTQVKCIIEFNGIVLRAIRENVIYKVLIGRFFWQCGSLWQRTHPPLQLFMWRVQNVHSPSAKCTKKWGVMGRFEHNVIHTLTHSFCLFVFVGGIQWREIQRIKEKHIYYQTGSGNIHLSIAVSVCLWHSTFSRRRLWTWWATILSLWHLNDAKWSLMYPTMYFYSWKRQATRLYQWYRLEVCFINNP